MKVGKVEKGIVSWLACEIRLRSYGPFEDSKAFVVGLWEKRPQPAARYLQ